MFNEQLLEQADPLIAGAVMREFLRQESHLELIASENYASPAVLAAQGSVLTNKYAEGYPGRRYYGGCEYVDEVEELGRQRACDLFGAEHANLQPHSGAQANMAVYYAALEPGDTVLGMSLAHGGHLTHGSPVNFSGRTYKFVAYGVDPQTERINYDQLMDLALQYRPRVIVAGASSYPREIDFVAFRQVADAVGGVLVVDMAHIAGLVAAGLHQSPIPYAELVTSTTHKTLRGPRGGMILCRDAWAPAVDKAVFPGIQGGPLMHVIAAKAVALHEAATPSFRQYQAQVVKNAATLAGALEEEGYRPVSGGTDNHMILLDLRPCSITGREAEEILDQVGITVNKNAIPFDTQPPTVTSGIRVGTPAVTTRGMDEGAMVEIARAMALALRKPFSEARRAQARRKVQELCASFPVYGKSACEGA